MTILLTGASEPLGLVLASRLLDEQRPLRLLARRPHRVTAMLGDSLDLVEWHPASEAAPAGVLDGVTTLVHLEDEAVAGGAATGTIERARGLRQLAAERLAEQAGSMQLARVVAASSVAVYPDAVGEVYTESSPIGPKAGVEGKPLQAAAIAAEAAVTALRVGSTSLAFARFGIITGIPSVIDVLQADVRRGLLPPLGDRLIPAIHVDDAVALLVGLIDNPRVIGPVNAVSPASLDGGGLVARLSEGGRRPWLPVPEQFARRRYGDAAELILRRSRIVPRRLIEEGCTFTRADVLASLAGDWALRPARTVVPVSGSIKPRTRQAIGALKRAFLAPFTRRSEGS